MDTPMSPDFRAFDTAPTQSTHEVLSSADAAKILELGRRTQLPKESLPSILVHELFEAYAHNNPSATALEFEGETPMTYSELDLLSSNLAADIHQNHAIEANVMVPILFDPSFEMIVAMLAIMKAGGAYVPLGTDLPKDALEKRIALIGGPLLICGKNLVAQATEAVPADTDVHVLGYSTTDTGTEFRRGPSSSVSNPAQLAYVIFTSGTTGVPNGVGVEHQSLAAFLVSSLGVRMGGNDKRKLLLAPYTFDVSTGDIFSTITSGGVLNLVRREKMLSNLPHWIDATRTTHLSVTPSVGRLLPTTGLPFLTHIIFAGEILPPDLAERISMTRTVINAMGPTEATVYATFFDVPKSSGTTRPDRIPIGYPVGTTILYVLRPSTMELCALSEAGEICIGGPQVARGYITNPELSKLKFVPDVFQGTGRIFRTGDWGRWNQSGQLEILGRMDSQLKFHGVRVEAKEIERVVKSGSDGVDLVYVTTLEVKGDQKLVGIMILTLENSTGTEGAVTILDTAEAKRAIDKAVAACIAQLAPAVRPTVWLCLNTLPKTAHGKFDQRGLHTLIHDFILSSTLKKASEPGLQHARTEKEEEVVSVVSSVLALPKDSIDLDATFMELGGSSIQAMRVTTSLRTLGINASVIDVLDGNKTLALLAGLAKFDTAHAHLVGNFSEPMYAPFSLAPPHWEEAAALVGFTAGDIEDIYPCTALAKYWLELALLHNGRALICQYTHLLGPDIDPERFAWAWEQLRRHETTLRTVFIRLPVDGPNSESVISSVVLAPDASTKFGKLETLTVADDTELQQLTGKLFADHQLRIGEVPLQTWLIFNEAANAWSFVLSQHHALHDDRTLDLQHAALSLLHAQGPSAPVSIAPSSPYGAYMSSIIRDPLGNRAVDFWTEYLANAHCAVWPSTNAVPASFCKDVTAFSFHIALWSGSIHKLAKRLGVTAGAIIRGAYAFATAEGDGNGDTLVFEIVDGSQAAGFAAPPWGLCLEIKPTRIQVPGSAADWEAPDKTFFTQIVREANRSHSATLPYLRRGWEMSEKLLGGNDVVFATCSINILDFSRGDFRTDMKTVAAAPEQDGVPPIFTNSLAFESIVGVYVPVVVQAHIFEDRVMYACPYDPSNVPLANIERFVRRQIEVLETLASM